MYASVGVKDDLHDRVGQLGWLLYSTAVRSLLLLAVVLANCALALAHAQRVTPQVADGTEHIAMGQPVVPLTGPSKFHIGDNLQWAETHFDDSAWETLTLPDKPRANAGAPVYPEGFLPGWGGSQASAHRLMLMSDRIAEAQDKQGQLFGFEHIHKMLQKPITVAEVATAAKSFGQQEDISVLSVTRNVYAKAAIA